MSYFIVDVEADGPCPGLYSMVSFGAVRVDNTLTTTFHGKVHPITEAWMPEALAVSGITREEHLTYPDPFTTMADFLLWVDNNTKGKPIFTSDNPAFDWQFMNYYFHKYCGTNPFGFSARRIGDIYSGAKKDLFASSEWKKLRRTKHTHNPVDDAKGNAEALITFCTSLGIKIGNSFDNTSERFPPKIRT
jgi:DNA polymerase III epsilon subunit-like protein